MQSKSREHSPIRFDLANFRLPVFRCETITVLLNRILYVGGSVGESVCVCVCVVALSFVTVCFRRNVSHAFLRVSEYYSLVLGFVEK